MGRGRRRTNRPRRLVPSTRLVHSTSPSKGSINPCRMATPGTACMHRHTCTRERMRTCMCQSSRATPHAAPRCSWRLAPWLDCTTPPPCQLQQRLGACSCVLLRPRLALNCPGRHARCSSCGLRLQLAAVAGWRRGRLRTPFPRPVAARWLHLGGLVRRLQDDGLRLLRCSSTPPCTCVA